MKEVTVQEVPVGAQLIDVREPEEYAEVHAAGAVNIPLSELPQRTGEIDTDRPVYLICKSGGRSAQAAAYLEQSVGYDNLINVEGGTTAWVRAGLSSE